MKNTRNNKVNTAVAKSTCGTIQETLPLLKS